MPDKETLERVMKKRDFALMILFVGGAFVPDPIRHQDEVAMIVATVIIAWENLAIAAQTNWFWAWVYKWLNRIPGLAFVLSKPWLIPVGIILSGIFPKDPFGYYDDVVTFIIIAFVYFNWRGLRNWVLTYERKKKKKPSPPEDPYQPQALDQEPLQLEDHS